MGIVFPSGTQTDVPNIVYTRIAANNQTAMEYNNLPSDVYRIEIIFDSLSSNGNNPIGVQLGTSAGWITSGYAYSSNYMHTNTGNTLYSDGFFMRWEAASAERAGRMNIFNVNSNRWLADHLWGTRNPSSYGVSVGGGVTDLGSSALTRVRVVCRGLSETFDSGWAQFNLYYE